MLQLTTVCMYTNIIVTVKFNYLSINSTVGALEIPGCTGACRLSYCSACFYSGSSDEVVQLDLRQCQRQQCSDLNDYSKPSVCYWNWSRCAGKLWSKANMVRFSGLLVIPHVAMHLLSESNDKLCIKSNTTV